MKKNKLIIFIVALILVFAYSVYSEPGDFSDPLVSKSFVESKIAELKSYIDSKQWSSTQPSQPTSYIPTVQPNGNWQVVEVSAGGFLTCKEGTEVILRSGLARAVPSVTDGIVNGLSDVTDGIDLGMDDDLMPNHHLIIPRDDGRGIHCVTKCFFLVKGDYEVK